MAIPHPSIDQKINRKAKECTGNKITEFRFHILKSSRKLTETVIEQILSLQITQFALIILQLNSS